MKNVINLLLVVALLLSFGFCGISRGDEVADAAAKLAEVKAAAAKKTAEEKAAKAAVESVRRSQRTYSEFITENAKSALQVVKAGTCAGAAGIATADGYVGYVVAYPAAVITTKAFEGGNAAWNAAGSAWNAPVIATPAAK